MSETHSHSEISNQISALRLQILILLVALVIVSSTLVAYLAYQTRIISRNLKEYRPQATQAVQVFTANYPAITNFVQRLVIYGQTHPDFEQQVLKKYNITVPTAAAPKK